MPFVAFWTPARRWCAGADPGQSLEALDEAIVILLAWWSPAGLLRFHGRHCELEGARRGPKPAHPVGILRQRPWRD